MTTITKEFTKEQLIEQAKKNIEVLRGAVERVPGASDAAVIHLKLAEITLASLEAKPLVPVMYKGMKLLTKEGLELIRDGIAEATGLEAMCMADALLSGAPAPVVPDNASGPLAYAYKELTPEIMRGHIAVFERYGIATNDSSTTIQALRIALDGIERSNAMLNGDEPVSQTYKLNKLAGNSPVTPDGWISCSERMPDKLIPVMVMYEDGEMWSAMWNGNRWDDGTEYPDPHSVTHWREMPAAQKQEVNRS
ncbi:putative phage protein [Escherichia coli]|uniref:DUF551 domain-containing protein n=1 Tax=Escherichia coli TaxID=562 RepID=UPI0010C35CC6|nr:DUF551 domain-containing protein [Escherichia coli]GDK48240.1 putative phage protein [Escherichia coli]